MLDVGAPQPHELRLRRRLFWPHAIDAARTSRGAEHLGGVSSYMCSCYLAYLWTLLCAYGSVTGASVACLGKPGRLSSCTAYRYEQVY